MVPPVAVHVTAELYDPVPDTVAEHCDVCPASIEVGEAVTAIEVTVAGVAGLAGAVGAAGTSATAMFADPAMLV